MKTLFAVLLSISTCACGVTTPASLESSCLENCNRTWKLGCRKDHDCSHCARDAATAQQTGCVEESAAFQECVSVHLCDSRPCYAAAAAASACETKSQ